MKKITNLFFGVLFVTLSTNVFAETWIVTDSLGEETLWTKNSGSIPTEFFTFACIQGCASSGDGYLYTTSDNHTTGDFETSNPSTPHLCHWAFIGEKNNDNAKGELVRVCNNKAGIYDGVDGTWTALISKGNDKTFSAKKLTAEEIDKLRANNDSH